jgi:hypothetical protein
MCKALPPLPNASQEELDALLAWRDDIRQEVTAWNTHIKIASDMGAKLSGGIFNKETESIRQQLARSAELAPSCLTVPLHRCSSSQTTEGSPRPWRLQTSSGLMLSNPPSTEVMVSSLGEQVR